MIICHLSPSPLRLLSLKYLSNRFVNRGYRWRDVKPELIPRYNRKDWREDNPSATTRAFTVTSEEVEIDRARKSFFTASNPTGYICKRRNV